MSDLRAVQRAIGEVLIPEARAAQSVLLDEQDALAIALELYYTALSMKPRYHASALLVASRFAARMGLDPDRVEGFAVHRIQEVIEGVSE